MALLDSPWLQRLLSWLTRFPVLRALINRLATNRLAGSTQPRPRPFSLWWPLQQKPPGVEGESGSPSYGKDANEPPPPITDYSSWPSLTDKSFSSRHLEPASESYIQGLPKDELSKSETKDGDGGPPFIYGEVTRLFQRPSMEGPADDGAMKEDRSSVLFMFFAQWFTDSVLRIDSRDRRKNTSNHEIDLCQIYGLKEHETTSLRSHQGGKLRSQILTTSSGEEGEEYPDYLGEFDESGNWRVKKQYEYHPGKPGDMEPECEGPRGLFPHGQTDWVIKAVKEALMIRNNDKDVSSLNDTDKEKLNQRLGKLYATGLERGNSSVGYAALSIVFLREHNRICDELAKRYGWQDDERLFQKARMINICLLLKLTVEEYINHIAGNKTFILDPNFAEKQQWYRANWIGLEFDLLYRWHGLVPDRLEVVDPAQTVKADDYRWNNQLLEETGLARLIKSASVQPAGKIGLENNPSFLMPSEYKTIKMGRDFRLQSFNDYREHFNLPRLKSFEELTSDAKMRTKLQQLYTSIDNLEFVVGIFAEDAKPGKLFGDLMTTMVAYDAFTNIYCNPLLSNNVFSKDHLTEYGMELIHSTQSFTDLVRRNVNSKESIQASFTPSTTPSMVK